MGPELMRQTHTRVGIHHGAELSDILMEENEKNLPFFVSVKKKNRRLPDDARTPDSINEANSRPRLSNATHSVYCVCTRIPVFHSSSATAAADHSTCERPHGPHLSLATESLEVTDIIR
jgi:hypothetical protein